MIICAEGTHGLMALLKTIVPEPQCCLRLPCTASVELQKTAWMQIAIHVVSLNSRKSNHGLVESQVPFRRHAVVFERVETSTRLVVAIATPPLYLLYMTNPFGTVMTYFSTDIISLRSFKALISGFTRNQVIREPHTNDCIDTDIELSARPETFPCCCIL